MTNVVDMRQRRSDSEFTRIPLRPATTAVLVLVPMFSRLQITRPGDLLVLDSPLYIQLYSSSDNDSK